MRFMRRLWLLRHAKSSWDDPQLTDADRPLSKRGRRAAERMRRYLDDAGVRPDAVLCSSALRARETLAAVLPGLGRELEVRIEPRLYTFSAGDLLDRLLAVPDDVRSVLLVGHNPAIEDLAESLAREGDRLPDLEQRFPTAALALLDLDVDSWSAARPGCGALEAFVTPAELGGPDAEG